MNPEEIEVEVLRRRLKVPLKNTTGLEMLGYAGKLGERMEKIKHETGIADSGLLAVRTALEIMAEMEALKAQLENLSRAEERRVDGMLVALRKALE